MESEILSDEELAEITGYKVRAWQRRWLDSHHWVYVESRGKRPLVGRLYARMKLGIVPPQVDSAPPPKPKRGPDFSRINE
ncbi:DUF4224 domain-containing protein [Pseudomonas sp. JH-2]|uniref:DUF4224 domain-containing protein n=1 Tax=unclassified Pseudomonas TaxID=196821 RepID=UPI000D6FD5E5|nr:MULTISPECIES: DUF4224 domain-containing protein [unclassified Pseudomonas]MED5607850.1 DUF4224 domain-containing protein [Pseudomonas sp. JH-2]PWU30678.1 hypothetical protein DK254_11445 [Pseudomonas sp. RW407]PWU32111.1 hypothetical protein DK254_00025 [Pseudomonas sp. RW407]